MCAYPITHWPGWTSRVDQRRRWPQLLTQSGRPFSLQNHQNQKVGILVFSQGWGGGTPFGAPWSDSTLAELDCARVTSAGPSASLLVKRILLQQSAKGGEVRNPKGSPHSRSSYQEIPAAWFVWHTVLSVPWSVDEDNINVAEARGRNLALRLRAQRPELQGHRFLHLLDSQVILHVAAKGRSGSV